VLNCFERINGLCTDLAPKGMGHGHSPMNPANTITICGNEFHGTKLHNFSLIRLENCPNIFREMKKGFPGCRYGLFKTSRKTFGNQSINRDLKVPVPGNYE
jgi:hypothetical protein